MEDLGLAFRECTSLKKIRIPGGVKAAGGFSGCNSLEEIIFEEGVEEVYGFGYSYSPNGVKIYLPSTLKYLDRGSLYGDWTALTIYYAGSLADWSSVEWGGAVNAHYYYDVPVICTDGNAYIG